MNVKKIVAGYLKENGFDGLVGDSCGCGIDDLFCCEFTSGFCVPAYRINEENKPADCPEKSYDCYITSKNTTCHVADCPL